MPDVEYFRVGGTGCQFVTGLSVIMIFIFSFLFYCFFSLCSYCLNNSERPSVSFLVLTLTESTSPLRVSVIDLFILLYDLRAVADVSGTWCWPSLWNCKRSSSTLPQGATAFQSEEWPTSTSKSPRLMSRPTGRF